MPERFLTLGIHTQGIGMAMMGDSLTLGAQEWTHPVKNLYQEGVASYFFLIQLFLSLSSASFSLFHSFAGLLLSFL